MQRVTNKALFCSLIMIGSFGVQNLKAACREVSIFIQHPCGPFETGHVGLSVDEEFYDFGPYVENYGKENQRDAKKKKLYTIGTRGYMFYDRKYTNSKDGTATRNDIRKYLKWQQSCPAYELLITVTPQEAAAVNSYWRTMYTTGKFPRFNVFGKQCVTVTKESLIRAGLLAENFKGWSPKGFQKQLVARVLSTCGQQNEQAIQQIPLRTKD